MWGRTVAGCRAGRHRGDVDVLQAVTCGAEALVGQEHLWGGGTCGAGALVGGGALMGV